MENSLNQIDFQAVLTALADLDQPFPARYLTAFSDLSGVHLRETLSAWKALPPERKIGLLEDLEDLLENDTLLNFEELAKGILDDADPRVRTLAIRLLWESEDGRFIPAIVDLMRDDLDEVVRATAASLLGRFVLLGELDRIKDEYRISVVKNLLEVMHGNELPIVKQQVLESLGYSSHPQVTDIIKTAYESGDSSWVASALCAMGRSADEQWEPFVTAKLDSAVFDVQFEAIRAAGELEINQAKNKLLALIDQEADDEIHFAIIWSLSQIGGDEVREKLEELLENSTSEDEIDLLEKALENLEVSGFDDFDFMDLNDKSHQDNDDDEDEIDSELDEMDEFEDIDSDDDDE